MIQSAIDIQYDASLHPDLGPLLAVLSDLRERGKISCAILFGSYARGDVHVRSDIDLALFLGAGSASEEMSVIDEILMSVERPVDILRLDDADESPFVVQEALKGIHLVPPDTDMLFAIAHRALHEAESIRFRRSGTDG